MSGLNPNLVLAALVAVVLIGVGALLALFLAGGTEEAILARAGLITALAAPVLPALLALLAVNRQQAATQAQQQQLNGHQDDLEAADARIAFLEERLGMQSQAQEKKP